jgi:hypothetical protein
MKVIAISVLILLFIAPGLYCQNKTGKKKVYKVWVTKMDGSKIYGFLFAANEQGISITETKSLEGLNSILVEVENIREIRVRRKGSVGRGAGWGAVSGAALGAIIGLASGDDPENQFLYSASAEEKAGVSAIVLGGIGGGFGAIIGTGKKKILIDGNTKVYVSQLTTLKNYSLTYN